MWIVSNEIIEMKCEFTNFTLSELKSKYLTMLNTGFPLIQYKI